MFEAKYHGRCAECEDEIEPGDRVRYVDGGLVHVGCLDPALRVRRRQTKAEVCTTCWLERPCPCDDEGRAA